MKRFQCYSAQKSFMVGGWWIHCNYRVKLQVQVSQRFEIDLRPGPELDNIEGGRRSQGPKFPGSIVHRFNMVISRWSLTLKKVHLVSFDMSTFISVLEWDQILHLFVPSNHLVLLCTSTDLQIGQQDECNIVPPQIQISPFSLQNWGTSKGMSSMHWPGNLETGKEKRKILL